MTVDVSKFLRPQGAIEAAVGAIPTDQATTAAGALVDSYRTLRQEVRGVIDDAVREEFDRLFPEMQVHVVPDMRRTGFDPFAAAQCRKPSADPAHDDGWMVGRLPAHSGSRVSPRAR